METGQLTTGEKKVDLERLADLIIEALKAFSARGEHLTPLKLSRVMADWPETWAALSGDQDALADQGACLAELKETYRKILTELETDLGEDYLKRLNSLREQVEEVGELERFVVLRPELEALISVYARRLIETQDRAGLFIAELVRSLAEAEDHFMASVGQFKGLHQANAVFNSGLQIAIDEITASVSDGRRLDNLKKQVLLSLKRVKEAVEAKRRDDEQRLEEANQEMEALRGKFAVLKLKADQLQNENRSLVRELQVDSLTGAYTRRAYERRLNQELERFERYARVFSMVMFDVDQFKRVNDTYGHTVGDKCLGEIIKKIKSMLRRVDLLARYGGDEFVILLPETDQERARQVAEKIRQEIELTQFVYRGQAVPITISLGLTQVRSGAADPEGLVNLADQALYKAKNLGGNRVAAA